MATLVFENNNHNVFSEDAVDPIVSMINRYDNDLRLFESLLTLDFVEAYNESGNAVLTEAEEKKLQESGAKKVLNTIIEFIKSIPERIMKLITMFLEKIKKFYREHIKTKFGGKKPAVYLKEKRKSSGSKAAKVEDNEESPATASDEKKEEETVEVANIVKEDFTLKSIDNGLREAERMLGACFDYFKSRSEKIIRLKDNFEDMNNMRELTLDNMTGPDSYPYFVDTDQSSEYEYEGKNFDIVLGYLEDGAYNKVEKTLKKTLNELRSIINQEQKEILSIQTSDGPVVYSFIKEILSKVYDMATRDYKSMMSNFTKALSCATSVFNKFTRSSAVDESTYLYDLALNEYMEEALALDF